MERLTDVAIRALKPPERGQKIYLDGAVTGFGVRVSPGGTKTFVLTFGADRRRVSFGSWPIITLAKARELAREKLAQVQLGAHHKPIAYGDLKKRYLTDAKRRTRTKTYDGYVWFLDRVNFTGDANAITTRMITDATKDLAPSVKEHVTAILKLMFTFGVKEGLLRTSPADVLTVRKSKGRKRVLTDDELESVWHAVPANNYGTIVRLLILTGQRREEIKHIKLYDGDMAKIPGEFTKNHRDHVFPVRPETIKLLEQGRTWGGWSKSKVELDEASGVTGWTLHDLRRTFRTKWAQLRLPREVAEKYINHISGVQDPVEQTYDQHDYIPEMRHNIEVYTDHIMKLIAS